MSDKEVYEFTENMRMRLRDYIERLSNFNEHIADLCASDVKDFEAGFILGKLYINNANEIDELRGLHDDIMEKPLPPKS